MPEVLATCSGSSATEQFNPILFFWRNLSEPSETSLEETLAFYSFWKFVVEFGVVIFENGKSELVPLKEQILIFRADSFHYTRHFPYQTRGHETSRYTGTEGRSVLVDSCRHFWKTVPESKSVIVSLAGMSKLSLGNVNLPQSWGRFLSSGCSQYGSSVTVTFEWVGFVITNTKLFSLDFLWFLLKFLILHFLMI